MRRVRVFEDFDRMGGEIYYKHGKEHYMHDPELREAFEAGCEHGYEKAMGHYGERRYIDDRGRVIRYRDEEHDREWDDYMERRRRDGRGRFI